MRDIVNYIYTKNKMKSKLNNKTTIYDLDFLLIFSCKY